MNWRWGLYIILGTCLLTNLSCKKADITKQPLIYGHAGTSLSEERAVFPPNSEKAIFYGLDVLAANGAEMDIQLTKDSVVVLYHDPTFKLDAPNSKSEPVCIAEITWSEIQTYNKKQKHPIIRLSYIVEKICSRNKKIMLDLKHYNYCAQEYVNFSTFAWAINKELEELTNSQKQNIIINTRNVDLLNAMDNAYQKSFETDNIDLGILYNDLYTIDLLTIKLKSLTEANATKLHTANLKYAIVGVKIKKEIKATAKFSPQIIISDNIAATRNYYY